MICAIVPAAGKSLRMGRQKLLLPFGSGTVISHIVDQLLTSQIAQVFVVVSSADTAVAGELSGRTVEIVVNPDPDSDMLDSVRRGLRALPHECQAVLLALGDQPSITTALVNKLIDDFESTGKDIIVPQYQGRRGHPVVFSTRYRDEILRRYDDTGLHGLLHAHQENVFLQKVDDSSVLEDIDYPEDYDREVTSHEQSPSKSK